MRESYVSRLVELRKSKGMTEVVAREQLADSVMLGTLMLEKGEVDGLVSGEVHTTANIIRPPLQLIKTAPGSSRWYPPCFSCCCLIRCWCTATVPLTQTRPPRNCLKSLFSRRTSAAALGIEPHVAMISYPTGNSGAGSDVEKVREATRLAQEKRPDLIIDGPL